MPTSKLRSFAFMAARIQKGFSPIGDTSKIQSSSSHERKMGDSFRLEAEWNAIIDVEVRAMRWALVTLVLGTLITMIPLADALAQNSAARGAVSGAVIGGAVGGRRGAGIGAATGAVVGSHHRRHWHNHYYWRHGACWVRTSGRSHQVSNRYCR